MFSHELPEHPGNLNFPEAIFLTDSFVLAYSR